ncbi:GDCCVxC domain-containing (seleno)protein [Cupriavidus necator]
MRDVILESIVTCPHCGWAQRETMPTDACVFFYACQHCKVVLRPRSGDCCVFCSFGSVRCPPMQQGQCCERSRFE